MTFSNDPVLLALALAIPALATLAIAMLGRWPNLREAATLAAAVLLFGVVMALLAHVLSGARPELHLVSVAPGLSLALKIDPLGMLFAAVAATLWIVNSLYSIGYMRGNDEPRQTIFYACFAIAIFATMGLAFSGNLFTLFVFYEVLSLSTYPLVTHKQSPAAMKAGRVYLLTLVGASMVLLLPAIVWTGLAAGTLDFRTGGILAGKLGDGALALLFALFVFGAAKAAVMPLHRWLPAAMVAPTPVSALLHAVAVVKAGVFTILKVAVSVFGIETLSASGASEWLVYVAGFTIVAASVVALRADDLKRRLAYSTIGQLSYIVLAAALASPVAVLGAALHIAAHAVSKITLFFAAGSVYTAEHVTKISQMDGIGRRMPWTMGAFAIGALSMIGLPPTAGFLGKWFILDAATGATNWFAVGVIVVSTVLNAAYFLPILTRAFLRPANGPRQEAPLAMVIALTVTAAGTVLLFLCPGVPFRLASMIMGG
ncbi:monovalent cation/H+ antiporter subunit D family protein [Kaistia nematophila]|uniref:Monovalent cation/H+ antiporter subunit D family protein n=1 Tax=Kaistia nematophila TaxID=2994654 RepID=A0A9X3E7G4_9HYPH|nr:monovalent cation/H+ antiporter subunit D family protein [Kaistia nematophila]MCX5572167.1 monovalent cation/H+ antiporter subunit D family protein [Kaistia nematophila]